MLPVNSAKDVVPGGPVSSNSGAALCESAKMIGKTTLRSTIEKFASSRAQFFAAFTTTARKVLQHSRTVAGFSLGLEWNGHSLWVASVWTRTAATAQWLEIASQEQTRETTTRHRVICIALRRFTECTLSILREVSNVFFRIDHNIGRDSGRRQHACGWRSLRSSLALSR